MAIYSLLTTKSMYLYLCNIAIHHMCSTYTFNYMPFGYVDCICSKYEKLKQEVHQTFIFAIATYERYHSLCIYIYIYLLQVYKCPNIDGILMAYGTNVLHKF